MKFKFISLLTLLLAIVFPLHAEIKPATIFGSNMVLQRGEPVKVWGTATRNEKVLLLFNGQSLGTKADKNGRWSVTLAPMEAGGPYTMTIRGKDNTLEYSNVLVGEVWLCSGQSNMEWTPAQGLDNLQQEVTAADYPQIRSFTVKKAMSADPQEDLSGKWEVCSPETVPHFTAVGYFFARKLWQELGIPIGIINSSWGGTDIEVWTSPESYEALEGKVATRGYNPAFKRVLRDMTRVTGEPRQAEYASAFNNYPALAARWYDDPGDLSQWSTMAVPQEWVTTPLGMSDGHVWFRYELNLPEEAAGKPAKLSLGMIDDNDITWVNGVEVGRINGHTYLRNYDIGEGILKGGHNTLTVRITDIGGGGGFWSDPEELSLHVAGKSYPLAGEWQYKGSVLNTDYGIVAHNPNVYYSTLYNSMINPLVGFRIKGTIWYQGENNVWNALSYRTLFPNLIRNWRNKWGYDFPFYWVQLADFMAEDTLPAESQWAELREAQTMTLSQPRTGQAVIIDIGNANDIHPRNKQDVGLRLALQALHEEYGRTGTVCSGPTFISARFVDGHTEVTFDTPASKLIVRDKYGYIRGFAVAGEDRIFHWAKAWIEDGKVIVKSDAVTVPVALRYAWANNPQSNLFNAAGLPAGPFRTDDWPGITQ